MSRQAWSKEDKTHNLRASHQQQYDSPSGMQRAQLDTGIMEHYLKDTIKWRERWDAAVKEHTYSLYLPLIYTTIASIVLSILPVSFHSSSPVNIPQS